MTSNLYENVRRCANTGYSFDGEEASIVCFENNKKKRELREAIGIVKQGNPINYKTF
jgi:hypothetical protein